MKRSTDAKLKILIVDDQEVELHYRSFILTEVGFKVYPISDSANVRNFIDKVDPDLLILDKMMPIDGLEIAKEIKKEYKTLPVLILSATCSELDRRKALALGCIEFLRKDIDDSEFLKQITKFCHYGHISKELSAMENKIDDSIVRLESAFK